MFAYWSWLRAPLYTWLTVTITNIIRIITIVIILLLLSLLLVV